MWVVVGSFKETLYPPDPRDKVGEAADGRLSPHPGLPSACFGVYLSGLSPLVPRAGSPGVVLYLRSHHRPPLPAWG